MRFKTWYLIEKVEERLLKIENGEKNTKNPKNTISWVVLIPIS